MELELSAIMEEDVSIASMEDELSSIMVVPDPSVGTVEAVQAARAIAEAAAASARRFFCMLLWEGNEMGRRV